MVKISRYSILYTLFIALAVCLNSCEKIDINEEEKDSTSADIPSSDIDKNKDDDNKDDDNKDNNAPGNDDSSEENGSGQDGNDDNTEKPDDTGYQTGDIVSVSEFLKKDITCQVWVVGRIVGDCTRSKKYAEFKMPFTHSQAILLADNPNEKDIENTISVCLTSNKGMRNALNLADNPDNHNQYVAVFGYRESYLGLCGIKKPDGYKFPVNIK